MRRLHARLAAACALAVAIAVFAAGAAFAGGGHGNGNGNGHDNGQQSQQQSQQGYSSGGAQSDHHSTDGQTQQPQQQTQQPQTQQPQTQQPQQQSSSQQQGVKPSNSTHHWTHTTVGAKPDVSKRYGNGKTAAQIAASRGAPASQPLTGPGNSQPHKTYDCRHKNNRSGGVDVHAIKSYSSSDCGAAAQQQQTTTTTQQQERPVYVSYCQHEGNRWVYKTTTTEQLAKIVQSEDVIAPSFSYHGHSYSKHWDSEGQTIFNHCKHSGSFTVGQTTTATPAPAEQHVTICHATGTPDNAGNGYVMISPSASGVYHGHYREHGADIIPPFTYNGQTFSLNWTTTGQAIFNNGCRPVGAVAGTTTSVTTTIPCTCTQSTTTTTTQATTATTTTQAATTTITQATTTTTPANTTTTGGVAGTTTTATTTTVPQLTQAAVTTAAAAPVGGVLGAQTSLAPKPASHGGVLGTVTHVAGSTLPFTGFPVWLAVLIALALILAGFALRRRTLGTRGL